jgi:hypothetical protein
MGIPVRALLREKEKPFPELGLAVRESLEDRNGGQHLPSLQEEL